MSQQAIIKSLLSDPKVLKSGHFVLSSGDHSDTYFNKREILKDPLITRELAKVLSEKYFDDGIDVVVGIAIGAIPLGCAVAVELSKLQKRKVYSIWVEKEGNQFIFPQTWGGLLLGKKTLIIEDVVSTGSAVKKVIELVKNEGGLISGVGVILNRGSLTSNDFGKIRLEGIISYPISTYKPTACKLCKNGVAINTEVGHGKEYLEKENC
jgi:orotate phosphoribosyltransferase